MIDQPELGKRLLDMRKERGLTQQELRERCHVSIRTIQRIESGAVMPRASTIRILFGALGENPHEWISAEKPWSMASLFRSIMLTGRTEQQLKEALQPAWIAGIVFLFINFLEISMENGFADSAETLITLIALKLIQTIAFVLFTRGFISLSYLFEKSLLRIGAYIYMMTVCVIFFTESMVLIAGEESIYEVLDAFTVFILGGVAILFGIALKRLQDDMGRIAKVAGQLEIAFGIAYLSLIFSFIGLVLLGPMIIIEIVLLFKANEVLSAMEKDR